jgi:hypothetical protein
MSSVYRQLRLAVKHVTRHPALIDKLGFFQYPSGKEMEEAQ